MNCTTGMIESSSHKCILSQTVNVTILYLSVPIMVLFLYVFMYAKKTAIVYDKKSVVVGPLECLISLYAHTNILYDNY